MPIVLAVCLILFSLKFALAEEIHEISGTTMGTAYSIKWVSLERDSPTPDLLQSAVDQRLQEITARMSTYDPQSELSAFNHSSSTGWVAVSAETARVVQQALEISRMSGGAFDPTVGRLVNLWSFGAARRTYQPPSQEQIDAALESTGSALLDVRVDRPALRKLHPDVCVDLSAIAKGFGVDALGQVLLEHDLENFLIEIGGEVLARGHRLGKHWTLGVEIPAELRQGLAATVRLRDQALATSGNYRNYFEKDGIRYSHTIDPATGRPVQHTLASASVLADDCTTADALATTIMVLGPERGLAFANDHHLPACLLVSTGPHYRVLVSDAGKDVFHELDGVRTAPADTGRNPDAKRLSHRGILPHASPTQLIGVSALTICVLGASVMLARRRHKKS
jgi:thiamine biosynthesis lipoprotein